MLSNLFFISVLSSLIFTRSDSKCLDDQRSSLLELKNELIFNSSISTKLVQWNQTEDCCEWYGVECDGAGNVVSLKLDREAISGGIGDSSTLFRLEYLQKLNLAYNNFDIETPIPKGIGHLTYLTHLNLSNAGFGGQVPLEISFLSRLVSLDISSLDYWYWYCIEAPKLEHPNLEMLLQNLTGLRELYLNCINITSSYERRKWSHIISSYLPHLNALSLRSCFLSGPLAKSFLQLHSLSFLRLDGNDLSGANQDLLANLSSLTTLSLVGCYLKGSFPNKIFQMPTLQHLDLSRNEELYGSMPPFPQFLSLKSIRLTNTNFSGLIPSTIGNLKMLSEIKLSNCKFRGPIPPAFANLTRLTYVDLSSNFFTGSLSSTVFEGFSSLVLLDLGANSFTGNIPNSLFGHPSLQRLYLSDNKFIGAIEEFPTGNVSKLVALALSDNRLEGPILDSFFQLQSLETLVLDGNSFSGAFQLDKIQSFPNLTYLDLSDNSFSVHVSNDNSSAYGLPNLAHLTLRSCNLYDFPHFIKQYSNRMSRLDLSNNRIGGEIPNWIWGTGLENLNLSFNLLTHVQKPYHIPPSLRYLDLQSNQLREELHLPFQPDASHDLYYLSLGNNSLSGSIPTSLCTPTRLVALDLSMNKLSGIIPSCLLDGTMSVLDLGQNNISGHIPDNFIPSCEMTYFDVNNNTIEGKIPKSIERCKRLELMNVGNNIINDTFPCMLSSTLKVLVLRSNRFHGEVKCYNSSSWKELQIIDISRNNFGSSLQTVNFSTWRAMVVGLDGQFGKYEELGYMSSMESKVGVRLTMKGLEVELVKIYPDFTAIDFSCNNFGEEMPNAIGDLISVRLLNFSQNALNGSIPNSFGKLGELESLDLSRNQLTGHIPMELSHLTFLSVLNVSYNQLIGEIPKGRQLQTFSADSFIANPGLCGFNLNISCTSRSDNGSGEEKNKREIEWEYISAVLGYAVGLGSFVWLLLFCRSFRYKYFGKIDEIVEDIFNARDKRSRRRSHARRVERNRVVSRH